MGMIQRGDGLGFALKTFAEFAVAGLDGNGAVQARIARDVRQATQAAQGSFDTVLPQADVEQLVAQIAASTIHAPVDAAAVEEVVVAAVQEASEPAPEKPKRRKKKAEAEKPKSEKELLLDSVLNALPEPKAPGQGRGRRRVTTAALTGTPVSATPAGSDDES